MIAVITTGSPNTVPHSPTARFEVTSRDGGSVRRGARCALDRGIRVARLTLTHSGTSIHAMKCIAKNTGHSQDAPE